MAYRKSDKAIAGIEARKTRMITATLQIIAKNGVAGLTTDAVARRARLSVGLIYKHWPDKTEMLAAATAQVLARDLALLRAGDLRTGIRAWARQLSDDRVMSVIGALPIYSIPVRAELQLQLRAAGAEHPALASALVYGAVLQVAGTLKPRDVAPLMDALMATCGLLGKVAA